MSVGEDVVPPPLQRAAAPSTAVHRAQVAHRLAVYAACTVLALACSYLLGVDVEWDTLDYHLYAGLSALHDRSAQDYFGAGPPAYFNPYAYVPFYLLVSSGLPALVASSVLAVLQSAILWFTFELALCVCPSDDRHVRLACGICAVVLAFLNPILIQQFGSSFADVTTATLVLSGWLLLARCVAAPAAALVAWGGLLLGAAAAFKLTNAVHTVAAVALLLVLPRSLSGRARYALGYLGAAALGFTIVSAPWAYRLARQFGNPFFPLLNNVFRSPEFTTQPLRLFRFIPESFADALWRPFAIANPAPTVQVEPLAADIRYAVLTLLLLAVGAGWLWRRLRRQSGQTASAGSATNRRVMLALGCGLLVDWILWLRVSGNGRYFLPMACVTAVLIVALLFRELAERPKVRTYVLAAILGVQSLQLWMGTEYRWAPLPWGGPWFQVSMPQRLATEPNLYLTMGIQSNAFIAPYLAPDSGLVNFAGGYPLASQGAGGARVEALIRRYTPHVRMLITGKQLYTAAEERGPRRSDVDDALERFSLRVDPADCLTISVRGVPPPIEIQIGNALSLDPPSRDTTHLVTCRVVPADPADIAARRASQRAADIELDRLEDSCPTLFQPRRPQTEHVGNRWQREYINTDLTAWVSHGELKFRELVSADDLTRVGFASDWARGPLRLACGRRHGHYFAKVVDSRSGP
ncbi:MAG: hypothetical protein WA747_14415 [Steroidobacteraceae bacterium]